MTFIITNIYACRLMVNTYYQLTLNIALSHSYIRLHDTAAVVTSEDYKHCSIRQMNHLFNLK